MINPYMTNSQMALVCAVEATSSYGSQQNGDAHTDRVVARAQHFLAFLESADEETGRDETVDRILKIHRSSSDHGTRSPYCVGCWEAGGMDGAPTYPCPTVRAITGAEES